PHLRNDFINAVLLAEDSAQPSDELIQQAIHEAAQRARRVDHRSAASIRPARRWLLVATGAVTIATALAIFQFAAVRKAMAAVTNPGRYLPHANALTLEAITPGDATVHAGSELVVSARIVNPLQTPYVADIIDADGRTHAMLPTESNAVYTVALGRLDTTVHYAVRIGQSRWPADRPYYTVTVLDRPQLAGLTILTNYPDYTLLPPATDAEADGPIEAPHGSRVTVTVDLTAPAASATLIRRQAGAMEMTRGDSGRRFSAEIAVDADDAYHIEIADGDGDGLAQFPNGATHDGDWPITAIADRPPTVRFLAPARDVVVSPSGRLVTRLAFDDDYGLSTAIMYAGRPGRDLQPVHTYDLPQTPRGTLQYEHHFDGRFRPGDVLTYVVEVADTRDLPGVGGPQIARTETFTVTVRDAADLAAERARRYAELRERLAALLAAQTHQRVNTSLCATAHTTLDELLPVAAAIAEGQADIRHDLIDLATNFDFDQDTAAIQQAVGDLAANEALAAWQQAQALAAVTELSQRQATCPPLARTQDHIIQSLQVLLALTATLNESDEPPLASAGADLPDDVREALEQLQTDLAEFIDAQRRIVDDTVGLAKRPTDDFTEADRQLLADLAAAEDRLEQFLDAAFTDLSKLAAQDFSVPLALAQLLAVKTDVTMAADALDSEAVDIAVAAENAGIENAQTLTANLEKWLRDVPDRERWSMEDPLTDDLIAQPDLPSELHDLIGDLLEEEEDLFDDIEDATSAWADSLDEGAGWDAQDGPISNMTAQGVTGNVLPNDNEISGRSGEGRTGRASGEHVQEDAVGLGGRRTPTRLTEEPFQAGQVNDSSTEPPGGATGGGKVSGAGGEGLEGPVPPELAEELERLAGQQAILVNRAERLAAQLDAGDLAAIRMLEAITLMNRVSDDLGRYRYRNALRVRDQAVSALQQAAGALAGEVEVIADPTEALPDWVRDDIRDAADTPLPAEFRDELQAYYRRIAEQADGQ
ncbi:MAG: hypothetical protein ACYTFO_04780, partial [Planctomycetota bacterium]